MFSEEDYKWMSKALEYAKSAAESGEVPIGAVIVLNGELVGAGQNQMEELHSAACHAEIIAINNAGKTLKNWRLDGTTMYVTLEPCPMCWGAIKNSRISRIVFGTAAVGAANRGCPNAPIKIEPGLLKTECTETLQNFFRNVRKIKGDSGNKAQHR